MLRITCICLILISNLAAATVANVILPHQHPDPEMVVLEVQRRLNESVSRRRALIMLTNEAMDSSSSSCLTGNPIDDCWRCDPNWESNRQQLANCGIGFGRNAIGGRGGQMYVVTDSSDDNPSNPKPGTLRFAVIQPQPLWITFSTNMQIKLKRALQVNSFKTIDGRGANIEIAGGACITVEHVSNVIIHNLHIHHCSATGGSDGDGISILASSNVWVDHCQLSQCKDGLIDVTRGSTAVTISNNYFSDHDKVMLLGHSDDFLPDTGMQVTLVYNRFGPGLIQRMPRCRHGYFHIANNDYTPWGMYAVGGSARPTINSQGNRYTAPADPHLKEVTKRLDAEASEWSGWNWRTEGDLLVNGAFFVPSGAGLTAQSQYDRASSVEPKPVALIDQVTVNVGVLGVNTR
ncbi:probable pectate lyase 12 [Aristolochia californica]|uniref:probable pectate lyase 12 n=1 Tax=Aristolochia californica TaxID=171875 RepID=UPI0035DE43A5